MKKIFTLLLTLIMTIGVNNAANYSGSCGFGLSWTLNTADGVLIITGSGTKMSTWSKASDVPWYSYRTYIKSVSLPNDLTEVGKYAFYDCSNLKSVDLPDKITSIGDNAFGNCTGMVSVTIPENVSSIAESAFSRCLNLKTVTLNSNTLVSASYYSGTGNFKKLFGTQVQKYILGPKITLIGGWAFYGCKDLSEVIIPDNVQTIMSYAFQDSGLKSITIGHGLSRIDVDAFLNCNKLTKLNINSNYVTESMRIKERFGEQIEECVLGDSIKIIGLNGFDGCTNLRSITMGKNITEIHNFQGCSSLTSITIPEKVNTIGKDAFKGCTSLTSIIWNAKNLNFPFTKGYKDAPFYAINSQIESMVFGPNVEVIPYWLCHKMVNLSSITFPQSLMRINDYAFWGCSGLNSPVTIPDSVTYIGKDAFGECTNLPSVFIGNSVTTLDGFTFNECTNLSSIVIGKSITSIDYLAFYNCHKIDTIVWNAINCTDFTKANNPFHYTDGDHVRYNYPKSLIFGEEVQTIPAYLFYWTITVEQIDIPSSVIRIGYGALGIFGPIAHTIVFHGIVSEFERNFVGGGGYSVDTCKIIVPCGAIEYYRTAIVSPWKEYIQNQPLSFSLNLSADSTKGTIVKNMAPSICDSIAEINAIANEGYYFLKWNDGDTNNPRTIKLTQDTSFSAIFAILKFTITFVDDNDTILSVQEVEYNNKPVPPANPQKTNDAQYTYTFSRWSPTIVVATKDATYKAIYNRTTNQYTITFLNNDSSVLSSKLWYYGATPYCAQPTKEDDDEYTYTFDGWTPEVVPVVADATYTASYIATPKTEGFEDANDPANKPSKVVKDGQILILRGDKTYTLTGQEMK